MQCPTCDLSPNDPMCVCDIRDKNTKITSYRVGNILYIQIRNKFYYDDVTFNITRGHAALMEFLQQRKRDMVKHEKDMIGGIYRNPRHPNKCMKKDLPIPMWLWTSDQKPRILK